ncbi:hypothetical protein [Mesorhizobium sp. M0276]|uniref:hypothetical protein n=1 Tax=Mesorhizobium sp. M0276 TaxID=2956928 RepID=UPI00333B2F8A
MIYGAVSAKTQRRYRNRVIGFLEVNAHAIRDTDKASANGMQYKRSKGWEDKWTYAIPVVRAWRVDEPILLERIAPKTYRPEAGQAIAVWNPPLLPEEVDLALRIKVTEVGVFGESPLPDTALQRTAFSEAFRPSRAFPGSFGKRTATYEDGPTCMYLARFEGDGFALLGQAKPQFDKSVLVKIGVSNDKSRRALELNLGFPPASIGEWVMALVSEPYENRRAAEAAEQAFKDEGDKRLRSLGGEFFLGDWTSAQLIFAAIPGVSRFGR